MNFIKNSNQVLDERAKKERKNKTGNKQSDYLAPKESTNSKNSSIKNIIGDVIHSYKVFKNWNFSFIMLVYVPSKHLVFSSCHMHYIRHSRTTNQLHLLPLFLNMASPKKYQIICWILVWKTWLMTVIVICCNSI